MAQRYGAFGRAARHADNAGAGRMQAAGDGGADEARHTDNEDGLTGR